MAAVLRPFDSCWTSSKSCSFLRRSVAQKIPVQRSRAERLIFSSGNPSPSSTIICSMTYATAGFIDTMFGFFMMSPINRFTVQGTAASRVFFRVVAKTVKLYGRLCLSLFSILQYIPRPILFFGGVGQKNCFVSGMGMKGESFSGRHPFAP